MLRLTCSWSIPDFINIRRLEHKIAPSIDNLHLKSVGVNVCSFNKKSIVYSVIIWRKCGGDVQRKHIVDLDDACDLRRTPICISNYEGDRILPPYVNGKVESRVRQIRGT